jgi:hypothetical protein
MREYRERLPGANGQVTEEPRARNIDYAGKGRAGRNPAQFFLLDLREYLDRVPVGEDTLFPEADPREAALAQWIQKRANVQLLPGQTLSCPRPGYFRIRICFTAYESGVVREAIRAVRAALEAFPKLGPAVTPVAAAPVTAS